LVEVGPDETIEKGAKVCVYKNDDKKVECGTVIKVKGKKLYVKVGKHVRRIKKGMTVKVEDDQDSTDKTADTGDQETSTGDEAADYQGQASPFKIWGLYIPALATPSAYNKLAYAAPAAEPAPTLWSTDKKAASALVGFGLAIGIPVGPFSINPGLRYRKYTPSQVDYDYDPNKPNPYVRVEEQATSYGLYTDFQYFRTAMTPSLSLNLTVGGDIDMSTVTFKATKLDDTNSSEVLISSATSKLSVFSLRFGGSFDYLFLKSFGVTAGLNFLLPLAQFGKGFSGKQATDQARGVADPDADLKSALAHDKNSIGYELSLGVVYAM